MDVTICFFYTSDEFCQNQWDYILNAFEPEKVYIIGGRWNSRVLDHYDAEVIVNADELPVDSPLVVFSPELGNRLPGTESLVNFTHPANPVYLFGPDDKHLDQDILGEREPDHLVYIPTAEMYSFMAAAMVDYDIIKNNA